MVLTDLPFEKGSLIHTRYNLIRRPGSAPAPVIDETQKTKQGKEYASFLRDQERKVGPEGYLDSSKYSHTFVVKRERDRTPRVSTAEAKPSVVSLTSRVEKDKKDYARRIKVIEDHMWQHKQEERELKRTEGDIQKDQRSVRHTLRDFENMINKKRLEEEKKLNQGLEKYTVLKRDHLHEKEKSTKNRVEKTLTFDQRFKDVDRKSELKKGDLSRQYKAKMSDLELKRIEVMRISQEFENKMKAKEEEQYKLKQELAELAIVLNMEAQKGRTAKFEAERERRREIARRNQDDLGAETALENKLTRSDGDTKGAELSKRKLSADLTLTKSHLAIKQRDEQRHLTDTQMRLDDNSNVQRQLNEAAFHADMDKKAREIDQKLEAHNARRITQLHTSMKQKKDREDSQQAVWEARFKKRYSDQQRREHEDSLKFFQKMVSKGEEQEQSLYGRVRNSEYNRQKQEQSVRKLQQSLSDLKKKNKLVLKQEIAERYRQERELEAKLIKEKAELDKVHAQREESYIKLQKHRQLLKEDKHNLDEHEREHTRLMRIGQRSDTYLDAY